MATLRETFADIAESIRDKGIDGEIKPVEMATRIGEIEKHHHWTGLDGIAPRLDEDGTLLPPTGAPISFENIKVVGESALSGFCQSDLMQGVSLPGDLDFSDVKKIELSGMSNFALSCNTVNAVYLHNLKTVGDYGLYYAFNNCPNLRYLDCDSLTAVGDYGMYSAFAAGGIYPQLTLPELRTIGAFGMNRLFCNCSGTVSKINLDKVESVGQSGLFWSLYGVDSTDTLELPSCKELVCGIPLAPTLKLNDTVTRYCLPNLTSIRYGVPNIQSNGTVIKATSLWASKTTSEIHFASKNQAAIEACEGYDKKWGATNATIYFDL